MSRPSGYRYGSWLVLHGSGAHLVGFSTSCWLAGPDNGTMGLWTRCRGTRCSTLYTHDLPGWMVASRVLSCVGVVLLGLWLAAGCQCHCLRARQLRNRWMVRLEELFAILSGCVSLLSVGVFSVAAGRDRSLTDSSLGWSLWLVVGGASACTLGGLIVAATRNAAHTTPKPCSRAIRPLPTPTSNQTNDQEGSGSGGREPARHQDVRGIFNVVSHSRNPGVGGGGSNPADRTRPSRLTQAAGPPPPPPYSDSGVYLESGGGGSNPSDPRDDPSSQLHQVSLSPPPSYEAAMNECPPPYEPRPE
ncbi:hypothetical protein ACOMHN_045040 [Nucella lapillus]